MRDFDINLNTIPMLEVYRKELVNEIDILQARIESQQYDCFIVDIMEKEIQNKIDTLEEIMITVKTCNALF